MHKSSNEGAPKVKGHSFFIYTQPSMFLYGCVFAKKDEETGSKVILNRPHCFLYSLYFS